MAAVFYGYPLLIENNKYGIVRHFEARGYEEYVMKRPEHLKPPNASSNTKTRGIPSNSQDVIQAHAHAIEAYVEEHVGINSQNGSYMGKMYFNRTLEDWIGYKIDNRTKYDLTISSGLALLAAQKVKTEKKESNFNEKQVFQKIHQRDKALIGSALISYICKEVFCERLYVQQRQRQREVR